MAGKNKSSIALLAILCLVFGVNATLKTASDQQHFPKNMKVSLNTDSIVNASMAYLFCNEAADNVEKNCSVVLQTLHLNGTTTETSCSFETKINQDHFNSEIQVIPVNNNRIIVGYVEQYKSQNDADYEIVNVRLSDCRITKSKIAHHDFFVRAVDWNLRDKVHAKHFVLANNGNDTFTILFQEKNICGSNYCRLHLDTEGNIVGKPTPWFNIHRRSYTPERLIPLSSNSTSEEYAVVYTWLSLSLFGGTEVEIYHTKPDGLKLVLEAEISLGSYGGYSLANKLYSVCFMYWETSNSLGSMCNQYDLSGKVIVSEKVLNPRLATAVIQPYNLPNGGLLIFAIECTSFEKSLECLNTDSQIYQVTKLDARGKFAGRLNIEGFFCDYTKSSNETVLKPHFYENEAGEYCLSLLCSNTVTKEYIKRSISCFSDEDFKIK